MESAVHDAPVNAAELSAAPKSKMPLIAAIVAGLAVGGGAGAFVAGPVLIAKFRAPAAAHGAAAAAEGSKEHGEKGEKGAKGAEKVLRIIDNLVLNPANSGGTRFLMLTVTLEVKDAATDEQLKSRDAEVRDAILSMMGRKTVEELTDMSHRDALKQELLAKLQGMTQAGAIRQIYFPQFVIQ